MNSRTFPVQPIDESHLLYGNFIGVQFVFQGDLDADRLQQAINQLAEAHPELTGRYDRKKGQVSGNGERLPLILKQSSGDVSAHLTIGTIQPNRRDFVNEPSRKQVQSGKARLSTFTLTKFKSGGCILGIAISHVLVDAAGFHLLAKKLARFYTGTADVPRHTRDLSVFQFGTARRKAEVKDALGDIGMSLPVKLNGLVGGLLRAVIIRAMDKMAGNQRIALSFSARQLADLKQTVLDETGIDWISTNVALCAHFTQIMAKLMFGDDPKAQVQIGQLVDLRSRYFTEQNDQQANFTGNAILIYTNMFSSEHGVQNAERSELAMFFKQVTAALNADFLTGRLELISDTLRHGYSYPGLELRDPMIALNNQSKMLVYDISFAGAVPGRVIPQDVGDNIMFFPTPDGGIEIYIRDISNPERQNELLKDDWQKLVFDF